MDFKCFISYLLFFFGVSYCWAQSPVDEVLKNQALEFNNFIVSRVDTEFVENKIAKLFTYDANNNLRKAFAFDLDQNIKRIVSQNEDEQLDGLNLSFFENGQVRIYSFYDDGTGFSIEYYRNNRIKEYSQSCKGKYCHYRAVYCDNGQLYQETRYELDVFIDLGYHCNGNKRFEGGMIDKDKKDGKWRYWDESKKLIKEELYNKGKLIEVQEY